MVIPGEASGIGQACAIRLAEESARIIMADLNEPEQTLKLITAAGGTATAFKCDLTNPKSVGGIAIKKDGSRCDILANKAGIYAMQMFCETTFEEWRRVLSVNLDAMCLMTKAPSLQVCSDRNGAGL